MHPSGGDAGPGLAAERPHGDDAAQVPPALRPCSEDAAQVPRALRPCSEEADPIEHVTIDRTINALVAGLPIALLGLAMWLAWGGVLVWQDFVVLAITYVLTGVGVTVGFHRLLTHRSFKTSGALRALFAVLGSAAVEGPVIEWVSTHRQHHRFSDQPGDPHSPHVDHGVGLGGRCEG